MSKTKEKISLIYKCIIIVLITIGLVLNFTIAPVTQMILYFTILSNIMCLIFYIVALILYLTKQLKKGKMYYIFKGMVTMCITLTLAVYQSILSGNSFYQDHMLACNFVHLIIPIAIILDYIIFGEKGHLKKSFPFIWSSILIIYTIFCNIYSQLGGTFMNGDKIPYFYMDTTKYGFFGVIINCLIIYIIYVAYGYLICFLDNLVAKQLKKRGDK